MDHLPTCVYNIQGNVECQSGCGMKKQYNVGALDSKDMIQPIRSFDNVHIGAPDYVIAGNDAYANVATMVAANIDGSYAGLFKKTQLPSM